MSFSKTFQGTKAAVLVAIAAFPAEQKAIDVQYYAADGGVVTGHAKQIEAGTKVITAALEGVPDEVSVSAGLWGHAGEDESGTYGFSLNVSGLQTLKKE
jgi:hypothetical protein